MKFGDKYELLDSLTTGSVETFVANDKVRGERVLVHILHCDPQRPNQPTVQWVLDTFRRVAPEPAGLVLEAGRYSGTLYAYLITRLPDEAAVQAWVKQYKAQARDTQEITAGRLKQIPPLSPNPVSPNPLPPPAPLAPAPFPPAPPTMMTTLPPLSPTPPQPPPAPPQTSPSSVTQLLREFEPLVKAPAPSIPPREAQPPSQPPFSTTDRSGIRPAPEWNPDPPRMATPPNPAPIRTPPADPFPANFLDKNFPAEPSPLQPPKESPKAGEFTSFFQGPFRGDRPAETPNISPPAEPPRKTVGDFTAMFGSVKPQPQPAEPQSSGMAGNEPAGTGFTGWFNPEIPSRTSGVPFSTMPGTLPGTTPSTIPNTLPGSFPSAPHPPAMPPSGALPRASADPSPMFPEPVKEPYAPPQPPPHVAPSPPVFSMPAPPSPPLPNFSPSVPPEGATRAFSRPGFGEAAPPSPPPPSGPSAYTQVISVRAPRPGDEVGATEQKDAPKSITPPSFSAPPLPPLPKLAPPPPPPIPKLAVPPLPPPPKPPKVEIPVPPVSYWPLVLTLTVVFVLAVLVVLYFVLKH